MAAGLGIGWGINWGSIALSAKAVLDYLTFKLNFNTIATDFTFTRNSFATRVNEFGLIETVTNLGSDLVQNGSFDELGSELVTNGEFDTDTDWTKAANWSIADGKASSNGSGGNLQQSNVVTANEVNTYLVSYDIVDYVSGGVIPNLHGSISGTQGTAVGSYSVYITGISSANTSLFFISNNFNGSIDNVSVKQVDPNDDWNNEGVWTIGNGYASGNGATGSSEELGQNISASGILVGDTVKCSFELKNYVSGSVQIIGISNTVSRSANGIYEFQGDITSTNIRFRGSAFFGDVTNLIIQEVIEDDVPRIDYTGSTFDIPVLGDELVTNGSFDTDSNWSKQSGWSIANGVATFDINNYSGGNANIFQNCMVSGKEYVLTYDVVDYVQGFVRNVSRSGAIPRTANGTYTEKFTASNANLYLKADSGTNTILSIDNVSVKEVTAYTTTDKGAFLLEPISTNELIYSEDLSSWATFGSPIRTGGQDDLSGGTSAYAVEFPTANDFIRLLGVNTVGTFTASVYAKKSIGDTFYLNIAGNIGNYNFSTESFTPGTGSPTGDMIDFGNGWYRCIMTFSSTSTSSQVRIQSNNGSTVILWACQLEELPYVTSYIPTSGTTVTRAQESCQKTNLSTDGFFGGKEGVIFLNTTDVVTASTSLNTFTPFRLYRQVSDKYRFYYDTDAAFVGSSIDLSANGGELKMAFSVSDTEITIYVNGSLHVVYTIVNPMSIDLQIWNWATETKYKERVKDFRIYDKPLTDEQLIELTTI
jgi:hypothetical protein